MMLLAERQLRVQMLQGDGGPGKALDQGALDGAQPIGATEITFDIGDKAIECLGRASAAVELAARKQLRLGCRAARRAPFAANRASTPRPSLQTEPRRHAHHGAHRLRVLGKINRLAERHGWSGQNVARQEP